MLKRTTRDKGEADPLSTHRERATYPIAVVGVCFLLPFSINDFIKGHYLLAVGILLVVLHLGINAIAIHLKKSPPIPFSLFFIPMAAAMTVSLSTQGILGALWCYPTVLFFYFVLARRMSNICGIALLVVGTLLVYRYIGLSVTIRFFVTMTLTMVIINIILNIISDLQRRLVVQAMTDPLTGVFNRRHMESCLGDAIERNRRSGTPASLLLIDIDHFKRINDRLGHEIGDSVLKGIVAVIDNRSRKLDLLFRMGGEEFILLLSDTRAADAMNLAEDLRAAIIGSHLVDGWPVSVSIGVSDLLLGESLDSWLRRTDDALYAAKEAGRNRVYCRELGWPADDTAQGLNTQPG
ncbi:MAG TPA: GGDEF domain-containing protein [Blastocatellia bacterium]|nr:GGDEF domain-containing protein [Blastocatellia bacterium]